MHLYDICTHEWQAGHFVEWERVMAEGSRHGSSQRSRWGNWPCGDHHGCQGAAGHTAVTVQVTGQGGSQRKRPWRCAGRGRQTVTPGCRVSGVLGVEGRVTVGFAKGRCRCLDDFSVMRPAGLLAVAMEEAG